MSLEGGEGGLDGRIGRSGMVRTGNISEDRSNSDVVLGDGLLVSIGLSVGGATGLDKPTMFNQYSKHPLYYKI